MKKFLKIFLAGAGIIIAGVAVFIVVMTVPVTKLTDLTAISDSAPLIAKVEKYSDWNRGELRSLPRYNEGNSDPFAVDLRGYDLTQLDLSEYSSDLDYASFDTDTIWSASLPPDFDPQTVMELGKSPGLGVEKLHEEGVTGKGVSIAIIDQALLLDHQEYKDNIVLYELLHSQDRSAQMHGPGHASIAVGKTTGVAPDAKVYYISSTFGLFTPFGFYEDLGWMAKGIRRVLEINEILPEGEKIRVISISKGFDKLGENEKGGEKVYEAIEEAKKAGVFVITTSTLENYDFKLSGLGRELYGDPEDPNAYAPGIFWADQYYDGPEEYWASIKNLLMVPMDSRAYASHTGTSDYAFSRIGGLSWTCPWLAGMYALCAQVEPGITPDEFIEAALSTGDYIDLSHGGKAYDFGAVINPVNLIEYIQTPGL